MALRRTRLLDFVAAAACSAADDVADDVIAVAAEAPPYEYGSHRLRSLAHASTCSGQCGRAWRRLSRLTLPAAHYPAS